MMSYSLVIKWCPINWLSNDVGEVALGWRKKCDSWSIGQNRY